PPALAEQVAVLTLFHDLRDLRAMPVALRDLGRRTALSSAQGGGMEEEEIEDQTRICGFGQLLSERGKLLFEKILQQEPAALHVFIEVESEAGRGRFGLSERPHPREQNLEDRRDGGGALLDQIGCDPDRKIRMVGKTVLALQTIARRWAEDDFFNGVAVQVGDLDPGARKLFGIQNLENLGQPLLAEAENEAPPGAGLADGRERPQHGGEVLDLLAAGKR